MKNCEKKKYYSRFEVGIGSRLNCRNIGVDIRLNLACIVKYRESCNRSAD